MNKMIMFGRRLSPTYHPISGEFIDVSPDVAEPNKQLLDLIYTKDPNTGLPTGDVAVFMSENTNPQVKQFIETALMSPQIEGDGLSLSQQVINKFGEVISDDDIQYFSRNHGETDEEFADRMRLFMENEKQQMADVKYVRELKALIAKARKSHAE